MSLIASMQQRDCPVCCTPAAAAELFLEQSLDEGRLTKDSFASRKTPEFMSYRLVKCPTCSAVFASRAPGAQALANAYHEADYSTAEEADMAAQVYRSALAPSLVKLPGRGVAVEVGTGTGVFLRHLRDLGFQEQVGIEPSPAAIAAAADDVKGCIREGIFTGDEFAPGSVSMICCFMTLEHVHDPKDFIEAAFRMLEPGGMVALVTHDYTAWINRMLGRRSPIIDIEHLQLFNPPSLTRLLVDAGYAVEHLRPIRNVYPVSYWMSLLPLPGWAKGAAISAMRRVGLAQWRLGLNVGNLLTVGQKPLR
jgi:SAM-dependent methyltransferase